MLILALLSHGVFFNQSINRPKYLLWKPLTKKGGFTKSQNSQNQKYPTLTVFTFHSTKKSKFKMGHAINTIQLCRMISLFKNLFQINLWTNEYQVLCAFFCFIYSLQTSFLVHSTLKLILFLKNYYLFLKVSSFKYINSKKNCCFRRLFLARKYFCFIFYFDKKAKKWNFFLYFSNRNLVWYVILTWIFLQFFLDGNICCFYGIDT